MKRKLMVFFMLSFALTIFCTVNLYISAASAYYKTKATATTSEIELSTSTLNKAKDNAKKYGSSFEYTTYISEKYELHIYHFEAPKSGYYNFYTTGSNDTIIKVYEHQNFLWWTTRYKDRGINDDGCKVDSSLNSSFVLELDKDEDYYICVRGWNTRTGNYTLHVEPNEDKTNINLYHGNYSHWTCSGTSWDAAFQQAMGAPSTYAKTYLTREEVAVFYWALTSKYDVIDPRTGKVYSYNGLWNQYSESTAKGISYFNTIVSLLCSIPGVPSYVGATATVVGFVAEYSYSASVKTKEQMQSVLEKTCGARREYYGSQIIDGALYVTDKIVADHGLCVANTFVTTSDFSTGFSWTFNSKDYSAYDSNIRVGVQYEKGDWEK